MKFGVSQTIKFGTDTGTYSLVTEREVVDSQITLTDYEAKLAVDHFGDTILRGPVKDDPDKACKQFRLHGTSESVGLNLVYPKPEKNELRLYIGSRAGFKPAAGEIWFLYLKETEIFIGSMSENAWRSQERLDDDDAFFQAAIYEDDEAVKTKIAARDAWKRDSKMARECLQLAEYKCEFDNSHKLFVARRTLKPYVEAHHLVPMRFQDAIDVKLDTQTNIFSLCPMCHSKVHHAVDESVAEVVHRLFDRRKDELCKTLHLTADEVLRFYNCEDIKR
jgi:5-methylcytosine-specific restriction endonuclease McrA